MPIHNIYINIDDILIEGSLFSLKSFLFESAHNEALLEDSFRHLGILHPVTIYRDKGGRPHLIDGKKRVQFSRQSRTEKISATVLPESTPFTDIITLILCNRRKEIEQSVMNKILFVCFAMHLKSPELWILDSLCASFGFKPYGAFLKDCERLNNLPAEMKQFCHEKIFSLKQILNFTHYPEDILRQLMGWKPVLQLTASTLDEISSNLKDYLRSQNKTIEAFSCEPEVKEIIQSALSPRDKTEKMRRLIYMRRFPVLSGTNARIGEKVSQLNLPDGVSINWDRTLENKNVDITVHVQEPAKMTELLNALNSAEMKRAVEGILDEL
jgi:hypothetical protein